MQGRVEQAALEWMMDTTLLHGLQTQVQTQAAFAKCSVDWASNTI